MEKELNVPGARARLKKVAGPRPRLWTRKEYYRLNDLGFFTGQRVELIDGEIIDMPPMNNPHAVALGLVQQALGSAFGPGYWARNQLPLHFGSRSEPEPDFAVVQGAPRDYHDHPTTALLVVEICDTSLQYDRETKGSLYARAAIGDYWIVNLLDNQLEVYRDPRPDSERSGHYKYGSVAVLEADEIITPLAALNARVLVRDLLP